MLLLILPVVDFIVLLPACAVELQWDEADADPGRGHGDIEQGDEDLELPARLVQAERVDGSRGEVDEEIDAGEYAGDDGGVAIDLLLVDGVAWESSRVRPELGGRQMR